MAFGGRAEMLGEIIWIGHCRVLGISEWIREGK